MASIIKYRKEINQYYLRFNNPLDRADSGAKKSSKNLDVILQEANKLDIELYGKYPALLPDGISVDRANNRFRVYTRYGIIGSTKTVREAMEIRLNVLEDLTTFRGNKKEGTIKLIYGDE